MTAIFPERTTGFRSKVCDGHPSQAESFKTIQPVNLRAKCASCTHRPRPFRGFPTSTRSLSRQQIGVDVIRLISRRKNIAPSQHVVTKNLNRLAQVTTPDRLGAATKSQRTCTTEQANVETSISEISIKHSRYCHSHLCQLPNQPFGTPWKHPMSA